MCSPGTDVLAIDPRKDSPTADMGLGAARVLVHSAPGLCCVDTKVGVAGELSALLDIAALLTNEGSCLSRLRNHSDLWSHCSLAMAYLARIGLRSDLAVVWGMELGQLL